MSSDALLAPESRQLSLSDSRSTRVRSPLLVALGLLAAVASVAVIRREAALSLLTERHSVFRVLGVDSSAYDVDDETNRLYESASTGDDAEFSGNTAAVNTSDEDDEADVEIPVASVSNNTDAVDNNDIVEQSEPMFALSSQLPKMPSLSPRPRIPVIQAQSPRARPSASRWRRPLLPGDGSVPSISHVVRLTNRLGSARIPPDYVSVSLEVPFAKLMLAQPAYVRLLRNLQVIGGGGRGPNVRVGGNSGEQTRWMEAGATVRPPGARYTMGVEDVDIWAAALSQFNGTLTLSLNMKYKGDFTDARALMRAASTRLSQAQRDSLCVGLGNEPDRFPSMGYRAKGTGWGYRTYAGEAAALFTALRAEGLAPRCVAGPGTASKWRASSDHFMTTSPLGKVVRLLDMHTYGLHGCSASQRNHPSPDALLADMTVREAALKFVYFARLASSRGRSFIIGESNSISCSGAPGVSDAFAGTLWTVDQLLTLAAIGAARYNLHGGLGYAYNAVTFTDWLTGAPPAVRPGYIGMFVTALVGRGMPRFARVVTLRSAVRRVVERSSRVERPFVRVHALAVQRGKNGVATRLVVLHKGARAPALVPIRVRLLLPSGGLCCAQVPRIVSGNGTASMARQRYTAPSIATAVRIRPAESGNLGATRGITIAEGLTFDGSRDGRIGRVKGAPAHASGYKPQLLPLCMFYNDARGAQCGDAAGADAVQVTEAEDGIPRGYEFTLRVAEIVVVELSGPEELQRIFDTLMSSE